MADGVVSLAESEAFFELVEDEHWGRRLGRYAPEELPATVKGLPERVIFMPLGNDDP